MSVSCCQTEFNRYSAIFLCQFNLNDWPRNQEAIVIGGKRYVASAIDLSKGDASIVQASKRTSSVCAMRIIAMQSACGSGKRPQCRDNECSKRLIETRLGWEELTENHTWRSFELKIILAHGHTAHILQDLCGYKYAVNNAGNHRNAKMIADVCAILIHTRLCADRLPIWLASTHLCCTQSMQFKA